MVMNDIKTDSCVEGQLLLSALAILLTTYEYSMLTQDEALARVVETATVMFGSVLIGNKIDEEIPLI